MVSSDKAVHSDLESKYDKDTAKGIDGLSLHAQYIELNHSDLDGECDEEIENQAVDVHTSDVNTNARPEFS